MTLRVKWSLSIAYHWLYPKFTLRQDRSMSKADFVESIYHVKWVAFGNVPSPKKYRTYKKLRGLENSLGAGDGVGRRRVTPVRGIGRGGVRGRQLHLLLREATQRWKKTTVRYGAAYCGEIFLIRQTMDQKLPEFHVVVLGKYWQNRPTA